jgi:very-long-chain ceramide synthase
MYYFLGLAFYAQALLSLLLFDEPRSDYLEYLLHHLVTIFLIAVSYHTRIQRYGLIILVLHDFCDSERRPWR